MTDSDSSSGEVTIAASIRHVCVLESDEQGAFQQVYLTIEGMCTEAHRAEENETDGLG